MYLENPAFDQLAELLDGFEGVAVGVEVASATHAPLVCLLGVLRRVEGPRIVISAGPDLGQPSIVTLDGPCHVAWLPDGDAVLHLQFGDRFVHVRALGGRLNPEAETRSAEGKRTRLGDDRSLN